MPPEALLGARGRQVVVGRVLNVDNPVTTNAAPPMVDLEVEEVLRGATRERRLRVLWAPHSAGIDYVGGDAAARFKAWRAEQMVGPSLNSRWILAGVFRGRSFFVEPQGRFAYSLDQKKWAVDQIRRGQAQAAATIRWTKWFAKAPARNIADRVRASEFVCSAAVEAVGSASPTITLRPRNCMKGNVATLATVEIPRSTWRFFSESYSILRYLSVIVFLARRGATGFQLSASDGILDESAHDMVARTCKQLARTPIPH